MATTSNTYTGNGSNRLFSITFPYLNTTDIDVYLNGVLQTVTTQYTFANATTVEFVTAPAAAAVVLIKRSTNDTTLAATFFSGSSIRASDLNENFDQVLYLAQETANNVTNQSTAGLQTQIDAANATAQAANSTATTANNTANGIDAKATTALSNSTNAVNTANLALPKTGGTMTGDIVLVGAPTTGLHPATKTYVDDVNTTATNALPKAGGTMTGVITYAAAQPQLVSGTAIASTSGTSIEFTSIPSWVKQITVMFNGVSTNGTAHVNVQLGSTTYQTTGYVSATSQSTGNHVTTFGFIASSNALAAELRNGIMTITNISGNTWVMGATIGVTANTSSSSGTVTLSNVLDRLRIIGSNTGSPVDTFDAGSINIMYEG